MPPKPKYTKDEIIAAALGVAAAKGIDALTAKELGAALGTSTSPIFTVFDTMMEVQQAVRTAALERFESYVHKAARYEPAFKQIGMQMILFAKEEPRLYQLLFMTANGEVRSFDDIYERLGSVADESLEAIEATYGFSRGDARALFEHTWIHTFGIGAMCATGMCDFPEEKISEMLTQDFTAMIAYMKAEK